jgi:hypothetical protein
MANRIVPEPPPHRAGGRILKIRLWGTQADRVVAVKRLRGTFVVQHVSRPRRDRAPSTLVRMCRQVSVGEGPLEGTAAR